MDRKVRRDLLLHKLLLERCYRPRALVANPSWNYAGLLRLVVAGRLLESTDFSFVQVGAFDGHDAVHELVSRYDNIRGIVVEPQEDAFRTLQETYYGYPNIRLVNAAISSTDGPRDFFIRTDGASRKASLDKSNLVKHKIPPDKIAVKKVECFTLESLLRKYRFEKVDLIQIDAEGHDYEIIKTIDFDANEPSIIRFEHAHLSRRDCDECVTKLATRGYRFLVERRDMIAILER